MTTETFSVRKSTRRTYYVLLRYRIMQTADDAPLSASTSTPFLFLCPLAQFEENMVDISLKILDRNLKYLDKPAQDLASRSDPIYVGRVISAMVGPDLCVLYRFLNLA